MSPKDVYGKLFKQALDKGRERDYVKASDILTRLVAESDDYPEAWLYLGRASHALGHTGKAVAAFAEYLARKPEDGAGWFFLGREYLALGLYREAARAFRAANEHGRDGAELWTFTGIAELKCRRFRRAIECLERAMGLAPDDQRIFRAYANALYVQAIRSLAKGEAELASQMFGFVIQNGMDGAGPRAYRAKAFRQQGRLAEALSDLEAARAFEPDDRSLAMQASVLYFATGRPDIGMAIMDQMGAPVPGVPEDRLDEAALERWRAMLAFRDGDYRQALTTSLGLIKNGHKDSSIRALAAQANFELGRYEKAAAHYRLAVAADQKSPDLRMGLAVCLWELGQWDEARNAARAAARLGAPEADHLYVQTLCDARTGEPANTMLPKVVSLLKTRPGDKRLMFILAECYYKTGRPDLAGPWFRTLKDMQDADEMTYLYLVSVAESLGDESAAIAACAEYLDRYPDNSSIRKEYVDKLMNARAWNEAAQAIEEGYAYGLRGPGAERLLAVCYRNAQRWREAASSYRSLLQAQPRNVELLLGLCVCLERSGARDMALAVLSRGAAFIGKKSEPYLALGRMLVRASDNEAAANAFNKASELAPADPRPLRELSMLFAKSGVKAMAERFAELAKKLESPQTHKRPERG